MDGVGGAGAEALPGEGFGGAAGGGSHGSELGAVVETPGKLFGEEVGAAWGKDEAFDAINNKIGGGGVSGGQDGEAAGEGFKKDLGKAFSHGGKDEQIGGLVGGDKFVLADRGAEVDFEAAVAKQGKGVDDAAANGQVQVIGAELLQGLKKVFDALTLIDAANEEQFELAGRCGSSGGVGVKTLEINAVGNNADEVGIGAILDEALFGEARGDEEAGK